MFLEQGANVFGGACPGHVLSEQPGWREFLLSGFLGLLLGISGEWENGVKGLFGCNKG